MYFMIIFTRVMYLSLLVMWPMILLKATTLNSSVRCKHLAGPLSWRCSLQQDIICW